MPEQISGVTGDSVRFRGLVDDLIKPRTMPIEIDQEYVRRLIALVGAVRLEDIE